MNAVSYETDTGISRTQGCILAGISFLSISSILLPTRKSGIRRDKYLSAAIFKEAVHSDDSIGKFDVKTVNIQYMWRKFLRNLRE